MNNGHLETDGLSYLSDIMADSRGQKETCPLQTWVMLGFSVETPTQSQNKEAGHEKV